MSTNSPHLYCNFAIRDTGIGIAEDKRHELPVIRPGCFNSSPSRNYVGTGLGLTLLHGSEMMEYDLVRTCLGPGEHVSFHRNFRIGPHSANRRTLAQTGCRSAYSPSGCWTAGKRNPGLEATASSWGNEPTLAKVACGAGLLETSEGFRD